MFRDFIEKDGQIVDNGWVKWYHFAVPDEEGQERNDARSNLETLGHCKECSVLSGCYFVNYKKLNLLLLQNLCKIKNFAVKPIVFTLQD